MVTCPQCRANRAHRSHRKTLKDYLAGLCGYLPYRCSDCRHRFLQARPTLPPDPAAPTTTEKEIRATRGKHATRRRRREFLLYSWALLFFLAFLYFVTRDRTLPGVSDSG